MKAYVQTLGEGYGREITISSDGGGYTFRHPSPRKPPPVQKTVQELLYFAVFPDDPIADWSKSQIDAIAKKYRKVLAIYDEAMRLHQQNYNRPYSGQGCGGSGCYTYTYIY